MATNNQEGRQGDERTKYQFSHKRKVYWVKYRAATGLRDAIVRSTTSLSDRSVPIPQSELPAAAFEKLDGPFVLLGRFSRSKRAQIAAPSGPRVLLAGIKTILA